MPSSDLARDLLSDAQRYVSKRFGGIDLSDMSKSDLVPMIEKCYDGGWSAFESDFMRHARSLQSAAKSEPMSPVKMKIKVEHFLGRKLRDYDRIESATFTDTSAKIVVSIAVVDQRTREDIIKTRRLELHDFTRADATAKWDHKMIDMTEDVNEGHIRYGAVMTPERYESMMEQFETCYRPGTDKAPMQGWVSRAGESHKRMHADEVFQSPKA